MRALIIIVGAAIFFVLPATLDFLADWLWFGEVGYQSIYSTEIGARALYQEAAAHCASVKDFPTRDLFEDLMADEEHHIDFLETQLDLVDKLGLQLYSQGHMGKPGKAED